jgi:putative membrane protein
MRTKDRTSSLLRAGLLVTVALAPALGMSGEAANQATEGDRAFLQQALGTNELELQLGRLAVNRANTPEVKAMGEKMIKKHTEFGQQLSDLAKQSGLSGTPAMSTDQRATYSRVESQGAAQFDKTFKQTVDAGHVEELAMYRDAVSRADSPQLRALAQRRVTELQNSMAPPTGTGMGK